MVVREPPTRVDRLSKEACVDHRSVDGTKEFIQTSGVRLASPSLQDGGRSSPLSSGFEFNPIRDEDVHAARGHGIAVQRRTGSVSTVAQLADAPRATRSRSEDKRGEWDPLQAADARDAHRQGVALSSRSSRAGRRMATFSLTPKTNGTCARHDADRRKVAGRMTTARCAVRFNREIQWGCRYLRQQRGVVFDPIRTPLGFQP
jgi:hypothetical protein